MEEQEKVEELSLTDKIVETFKKKTEEYSKALNTENFHYEELYQKGKKENGKAFQKRKAEVPLKHCRGVRAPCGMCDSCNSCCYVAGSFQR